MNALGRYCRLFIQIIYTQFKARYLNTSTQIYNINIRLLEFFFFENKGLLDITAANGIISAIVGETEEMPESYLKFSTRIKASEMIWILFFTIILL